ncbi:conserved hypothetical protein [Histoplasma capsulatum var. duboisii H88]|uniref:Uncharacterized protein n=2 Tax=Ajellomyces capsulatus TaxID=5037 RepID=F0UBB5_AJEC8|nr:conserved hypothetical protein [Histoplasma capsulatum H143]EGC43024.1 conserved hypothetical protein [Histoplasma capsulatum var. duboisii H88]QSS49208.1 hypothetical protein I7I53_09503 [Histoplasma capsulatum var. duboisii H88]
MGSLCSKSANPPEPFAQPGRVLGTSPHPPPQAPRASLSASTGRTLGGAHSPGQGKDDPRNAAARAAEERAARQSSAAKKGKLSSQLAAQKSQTRSETLDEASRHNRATRDADAAATVRRWD